MLQNTKRLKVPLHNHLALFILFILVLIATQLLQTLVINSRVLDLGLGSAGWIRLETTFWAIKTVLFIIAGSIAVGAIARWVAGRWGVSVAEQNKIFWGFFFASPWLIGFVIFVLGPALASLFFSLLEGYKLGDSIGIHSLQGLIDSLDFENYRKLLAGEGSHGRRFHQAMFNSFYYAIVGVPLQIFAALTMAVLLNQALKGIRVFRLIFYMPVILAGGPAILLAWRYMLQGNGGFVNESARWIADKFFLFDWLYRGFIYVVEGFNGFYAGLTRGDPIGPFKYTIPALIGVIVVATLISGYWEPSKRKRAQRVAEILAIVVGAALITKGFSAEVLNIGWVFAFSMLAILGVLLNMRLKKQTAVRIWQYGTIGLFATVILLLLFRDWSERGAYILALLVGIAPLVYSRVAHWTPLKTRILIGIAVIFVLVAFSRIVPGQLDGGRPWIIPRYLFMASALEEPGSMDYLEDVYPSDTLSSLWIYAAVAGVMIGVVLLDDNRPLARRYLLVGSLAFFALLMVGSFIDGVRYFDAFEDVAQAESARNYHFALFRDSVGSFPDDTRNPRWMNSELWTKSSLILITMWSSGAGMLIFLAALKGVPKSLYEAAEVDGANRFQKFFKITLPMISPAMFYNVVIGMIAALQTFEAVYILRSPDTTDSLASAAYYLYERTFRQLAIGEGSAMSWILALIIVTMTIIQFRYSDWVHYEA